MVNPRFQNPELWKEDVSEPDLQEAGSEPGWYVSDSACLTLADRLG